MQSACLKKEQFGNHEDIEYHNFTARINARFADSTNGPLFTTDVDGLFDAYLAAFPEGVRQHHNCHTCRHFIERFGSLVTVAVTGETTPAIWHPNLSPEEYWGPISTLYRAVKKAKITGVFLTSDKVWGQPTTGIWSHFYINPAIKHIYRGMVQTPGQAMAEKKEDFKNVIRALAEFTLPTVEQALKILKADALYRSEKVLGPAQWLSDLHQILNSAKGQRATNLIWQAVATAPAGFCHPRSSMIGTLLEDIASGMEFGSISRRFAEKMHPLQYLRPQVALSSGNIAQAEKIIGQMAAAGSLDRRFATIDEVDALWKPAAKKEASTAAGIFGHLKPKSARESIADIKVPPITITWVKFQTTVLPDAKEIEIRVPQRGDFIALVSATNMDAPPIIQWDSLGKRNPVSWYRYHGGSIAEKWGLVTHSWAPVTAACLYPGRWFGSKCTHGNEAMFIIVGAVDKNPDSLALFPEILKSEFHGIRATIEAFSRSKKLSGAETASACGLCAVGAHVRIAGIEYKIDRWD